MPENHTSAAIVGDPDLSSPDNSRADSGNPRDLVGRVAASAHETVDRLAEKAGPAVHKLESGVEHANEMLSNQAHRMQELGSEWTDSLRDSVRENPLTALLVALTAGAVIARMTR